jgi:hypothetical protein
VRTELDLTLRACVARLADEARRAAAQAPLGSAVHDFYAGVRSAAERRLHPGLAAVDDVAWLDREPPAFRDGYLAASALIATASSDPPVHLPLPAF